MSSKSPENIAEPASTASPHRARSLWLMILAFILMTASVIGVLMLKERQRQQAHAAKEALTRQRYHDDLADLMNRFARLEKTIATGVSYYSYSQHLDDVLNTELRLVSLYPVDLLPPARDEVQQALDDYLLAHKVWQRKMANRFTFIDGGSIDANSRLLPATDPLYAELIKRFPKLNDQTSRSLDIDQALKVAWQSASDHLTRARSNPQFKGKSTVIDTIRKDNYDG